MVFDREKKAATTLVLKRDDVHVWCASLNWPPADLQRAFTLLSPEEKKRAEQFIADAHRWRYIASHAILREILSVYLAQPAATLRFRQGAYGKPYLDMPGQTLQFNMSDSKQLALYAISLDREVGIDIEWMRPDIDVPGIAKRFFSLAEQQALLALPASLQLAGFYRCWTRKEAYIKVIGQGLSFPLNQFSVSLKFDGMDNLLTVEDSPEQASQWSVGSVAVAADGYAAALAVAGAVTKIDYFDWYEFLS